MGYVIEGTGSVAQQARRVASKQLTRAIQDVRRARRRYDPPAMHRARRRLKKVRALLRLIAFRQTSAVAAQRALQRTARALAPVADAEAVLATFDRLQSERRAELPAESYAAIRRRLVHRLRRAQQRARATGVLDDAVCTLRSERDRVSRWRCDRREFAAVAIGLRRTYKRARKAWTAAAAAPRVAIFHEWRRRAKDHWLQMRLISARSGNQLLRQQRQVERLDDILGRLHDYALLQQAIQIEPLDSRRDTAALLRLLRRCQHEARHEALALGRDVFGPAARRFVRQVRGTWIEEGSAPRGQVTAPWQTAA